MNDQKKGLHKSSARLKGCPKEVSKMWQMRGVKCPAKYKCVDPDSQQSSSDDNIEFTFSSTCIKTGRTSCKSSMPSPYRAVQPRSCEDEKNQLLSVIKMSVETNEAEEAARREKSKQDKAVEALLTLKG